MLLLTDGRDGGPKMLQRPMREPCISRCYVHNFIGGPNGRRHSETHYDWSFEIEVEGGYIWFRIDGWTGKIVA